MLIVNGSSSAVKVAVIGGGISACNFVSCLQNLSDKKRFQLSLYDRGRDLGGRASSRTHVYDGENYTFDHGAQYIGKSKSDVFARILQGWVDRGYVEPWQGRFGTWDSQSGIIGLQEELRYVPKGSFSSLCSKLLVDALVAPQTSREVFAKKKSGSETWTIFDSKTGAFIEDGVNYVVFADKATLMQHSHHFPSNVQQNLCTDIEQNLKALPLLTVMVVFDQLSSHELLRSFPFSGCKFLDHPILGWVANDSSKEGRRRPDGKTCFVLQSQYSFAEEIIEQVELTHKGLSFDTLRAAVNKAAEEPLLKAFLEVAGTTATPLFVQGHRWGQALNKGKLLKLSRDSCFFDRKTGIIAVGDYLALESAGKVEGAVLSSLQAAEMLFTEAGCMGGLTTTAI